ncbi:metal ABC transporter solute-binding protein, Zn/Mn family [Shouchella lehensis]|uniref:Mn2+/Zn2+ ABC transporter substrate-binding protein n=1 Tax=Shouchella lehensis TaxID=300825 RepID=A0A4Y7WMH8_9BACI|nr:zinc ABC transporter substrate-binding protein [Shouchella lehensis]MBG9782945.1 Mn2+/Zn2+ ABC transporter substrate-binding protein [Shouchella lehensis]TES49700.1 Mn2+/Zn2+ ABC transporter substrate-binding protein [Shouchella lehensis]
MNKKVYRSILASCAAIAVLSGCQSQDRQNNTSDDSQISVVASFLPMYEFTKQVAGDRANVQLMVSEGQDAHHYEPSAQDVATMNETDVFVYSSEEMEFWVNRLFNAIENDDLIVARAADGLDYGEQHHEGSEEAEVTMNGIADHYHTGDKIDITATLSADVNFDHWHWYQRANSDEEWTALAGQYAEILQLDAPEESFELKAVIYDNHHNVYAESTSKEIRIDNHGSDGSDHEDHDHDHDYSEEDNEQVNSNEEIDIIGLADHYHTGDVVTLVADVNNRTDFDQWEWFIKEEHHDWEAVPDQNTDHFEYKTTGESFEVKAVLYDEEDNVHLESEAVSVRIDDHDDVDPHIWLDPVLAQDQVRIIRDALIEADPDGRNVYEENADAFIEELKSLDEEYRSTLEDAENRVFVVQHQAFGYLADRYNLDQVAIGGLSTEVEPSPSRMSEIADLVQDHGVPVIYYQQGASSAIAQTVATETGTDTAVLYDLEVLSEELLENDLGYIEAMRHNLESLQISIY